jgi:hypothetical protein
MRGRRDPIAERASVRTRLHPNCGQQSVAFMQNERQEGSVPANLLCGCDGVVCVRGFVVSLVCCWAASEISEGCCWVSECWVLSIVVTYEIRVFFKGAQKEVFSSIFAMHILIDLDFL